MRREEAGLVALAYLVGVFLWSPAIALPIGVIFFQPLDFFVLCSLPLLWRRRSDIPPSVFLLLCLFWLSVGLSMSRGGSPAVLVYYLTFVSLFILLVSTAATSPGARHSLVQGFLFGGFLSFGLFALQILVGAENLDFRNNLHFRLPPHFGRGFALFPEVSTFAIHAVIWLGLLFEIVLTGRRSQGALLAFVLGLLLLMFTRSSSVIALLPLVLCFAVILCLRPSFNNLVLVVIALGLLTLFLLLYVDLFFVERLENRAANRSAAMRLASILAGLSTLTSGEIFGVGLGQNTEIRLRAHEIARATGLAFGRLPEGVNSLVVTRIFEEGWAALIQMSLPLIWLCRSARRGAVVGPGMFILAFGSLIAGLAVIGYRGIYLNWLWLGLAAGLRMPSAMRKAG